MASGLAAIRRHALLREATIIAIVASRRMTAILSACNMGNLLLRLPGVGAQHLVPRQSWRSLRLSSCCRNDSEATRVWRNKPDALSVELPGLPRGGIRTRNRRIRCSFSGIRLEGDLSKGQVTSSARLSPCGPAGFEPARPCGLCQCSPVRHSLGRSSKTAATRLTKRFRALPFELQPQTIRHWSWRDSNPQPRRC